VENQALKPLQGFLLQHICQIQNPSHLLLWNKWTNYNALESALEPSHADAG
jgi:hypothetical protein